VTLGAVAVAASFLYLGLLFAIARWGERLADAGRSVIDRPWVYSLSLAVYATSWTFYGSVGRAAEYGLDFLPIYIGPTLAASLWWVVLRKMIRISKTYRITSIADFIGSRYGKSTVLAGLVTVIAVVGCVPYIALQLKAISASLDVLVTLPVGMHPVSDSVPWTRDTAFQIAVVLATFAMLFGTRHLDATERHEGMVAAIAFESVVKLVAFVAVGVFVLYWQFDGPGDLFSRVAATPGWGDRMSVAGNGGYLSWTALVFLSMLAVTALPRQFQVAVVENVDERHLATAAWLFPLYLLAINLFVIPIALAGQVVFPPGTVDAETFMLKLPLAGDHPGLALLVYVGGLSAGTGMVIVETIALSTMICNDLVIPMAVRLARFRGTDRADMTGFVLTTRRAAIAFLLLMGYAYYRVAGGTYALVSIGLVSFAAVAQFVPALLGGMFWRQASRTGALAGLAAGFALWIYTLLLPAFARSGWIPDDFVAAGPFGIAWLRPLHLFGLSGLDDIGHALFWSLSVNVAVFAGLSLTDRQSAAERSQAVLFVDVFRLSGGGVRPWRGSASVDALRTLVARFLGPARATEAFEGYARARGVAGPDALVADADLVHFAETALAGAIGAASSRVMVASTVDEEPLGPGEVMHILDEASQVLAYSRRLEEKSLELERATSELRAVNARLQELDRLKDDFISTVTHELRTPLTSIRALSEILHDHPDLDGDKRKRYLAIIVKESERLTRLINQVLDLAKLESGKADWRLEEVDLASVIEDAAGAALQLFQERGASLALHLAPECGTVYADRDRLQQVMMNLLSNAAKFCPARGGRAEVVLERDGTELRVTVSDNGPGIKAADREVIFEKFRQAGNALTGKPQGTGLGLPISRQIVEHFGGRLWLDDGTSGGAVFRFTLPMRSAVSDAAAAVLED
jgi:Na+/proline symporter/nitrogen-specific signal transduction histidine kinase